MLNDSNLDTGYASVNSSSEVSVEAAKAWIEKMGERGLYQPDSARFRITALTRLTSALGSDEPTDAKWVLDNIDEMGKRYARKTSGNPETIATYVSRAKIGLVDFLQYQSNPASFKGRSGSAKPQREKKPAAKPEPPTQESVSLAIAPPAATPPASTPASARPSLHSEMRTFPLGQSRSFAYSMPDDNLKIRDTMKIFCHLMTMCEDFNPMDPKQAQFFSDALKASVDQPAPSQGRGSTSTHPDEGPA